LADVLHSLDAHARRRAYITLKAGRGFMSDALMEVLGRDTIPKPDYIYAVNILYQMGRRAKVDFIPKEDEECCNTPQNVEDYIKSITWSLGELTPQEEENARKHFAECQSNQTKPAFRNNAWALISWEK
jgi:hypothetical protein